jgi:hypothetical protein
MENNAHRRGRTTLASFAIVVGIAAIACAGCTRGGPRSEDQTRNTLRQLSLVMRGLVDRGDDLTSFANVDAMLKTSCLAGGITEEESQRRRVDYWGTPLVWRVCKASTGDAKVAVISCGRNRHYEDGGGDDLMFELVLPKKN